jgi:hypothetical protein
MSVITPTNFNVQAQIHIDTRLTQADITARDNISTPTRYWGMIVHVLDSDGSNNPNTYILQKGTSSIDIFDNGNWVSVMQVVAGSTGSIQINSGGVMSSDVGFTYDVTKDMLVAGAGTLSPDFGAGAHAQAGSWSIIGGEEHTFTGTGAGGGRPVNMLIGGWHHSIGDTTTGGTFSGASAFVAGRDHEVYGVTSSAIGFGGAANGDNSFVFAAQNRDAGGLVIDPRVLADGFGSFNMSMNDVNQTSGHGALADNSGIIGGRNSNIPADSPRSMVLGGDAIKATAATPDTVFVPNIRIGQGTGAALVQNDTETQIAVIDSSTNQINWRDSVTLSEFVKITLTQAQIQSLNTTPITAIPAPGIGKYIEIISASAYNKYDTAAFVTGSVLNLSINSVTQFTTGLSTNFIDAGADLTQLMVTSGAPTSTTPAIAHNTDLVIQADADSTGGGASSAIIVQIQYVIRDTN